MSQLFKQFIGYLYQMAHKKEEDASFLGCFWANQLWIKKVIDLKNDVLIFHRWTDVVTD